MGEFKKPNTTDTNDRWKACKKFNKIIQELQKQPMFRDELPLNTSRLNSMRAYAYWEKNINIRKFSRKYGNLGFSIFFIKGQEWDVFKRIVNRYPIFMKEKFSEIPSILRDLFGQSNVYYANGAWHVKHNDKEYIIERKTERVGKKIVTSIKNDILVKLSVKKTKQSSCKYSTLALEIKDVFTRHQENGTIPLLCLEVDTYTRANSLCISLKKYLPSEFSVFKRGRYVFIMKEEDVKSLFDGAFFLPQNMPIKLRKIRNKK